MLSKHLPEDEKQHECPHCLKRYVSNSRMRLHIQAVHAAKKRFSCHQCDKSFPVRTSLLEHIRVDHQGIKFVCFPCNHTFRSAKNLKRHFKTIHDPERLPESHNCPKCGKIYTTMGSFIVHLKQHESGRAIFVCHTCGKQLSSSTSLNSHIRIHTGERPFECVKCGKLFKTCSSMATHLHTHNNEKKYVCSHCEKKFSQHSYLTIHMRYHTGERPFSCSICQEKFISKSHMKLHSRKTHGIPLFSKLATTLTSK